MSRYDPDLRPGRALTLRLGLADFGLVRLRGRGRGLPRRRRSWPAAVLVLLAVVAAAALAVVGRRKRGGRPG